MWMVHDEVLALFTEERFKDTFTQFNWKQKQWYKTNLIINNKMRMKKQWIK